MKLSDAKKYLPFVQAVAEGKTIQWAHKGAQDWQDCNENVFNGWFTPQDTDFGRHFRIKPEPKLRPWKPEEVPLQTFPFRLKEYPNDILFSIGHNEKGLIFVSRILDIQVYDYKTLCELREYSSDHGKTWLPCGILEE
jgi:hypothetical protein